jgi:hypothetical protein
MTTAIVKVEKDLCNGAQVSPFSPTDAASMVKRRVDLEPNELAIFTRNLIQHHSTGLFSMSRMLLKEVKRRFKILDRTMKVDGTYREIDGARSFNAWLELWKIPKRNAYYILAGGKPNSSNAKPPWSAKTADETLIDEATSAIQKAVRDGDEAAAVYWIKQLYYADRKVWKKLNVIATEDIGVADLSVKHHILELEEAAEKCKNDSRHSDLLHVINAVLICCRAKKSRAADNAIIWMNENPTWKPADEKEIAALAETDAPQPVIPDKVYDMHTGKGRRLGRGMEHFKKEAAVLTNESDVAPWQPPVINVTPVAQPTVTATFFVIRRKSDAKFYTHGDRYADQVELAAGKHAAEEWSVTLVDLDKICHGDHEIVEVEATYKLTPTTPTEPQPTPEALKPTKKHKTKKQTAELPIPNAEQAAVMAVQS